MSHPPPAAFDAALTDFRRAFAAADEAATHNAGQAHTGRWLEARALRQLHDSPRPTPPTRERGDR